MSQQEVADLLGIPKGTMDNWVVKAKNGMSQIAPGTPSVRDVMTENRKLLWWLPNLLDQNFEATKPGTVYGADFRT